MLLRTSPEVALCRGDVHRPRRHEGDELVLVDGERRLIARAVRRIGVAVLRVGRAEPGGEGIVDHGHGPAQRTFKQGGEGRGRGG